MAAKDDKSAQEPTLEDLTRQIEALRADLTGIAETLKGLGVATGKAAAEDVKSRAGAARAAGEEQIAEMHARLEAMLAEADKLARDKPITAMGIAAGFGFLIGLMLGRR
jgi:ElaB/YqjD/DUF883 family membrane-anchored ribosome-binding protein